MTFDNPVDIVMAFLLGAIPLLVFETRRWFIALGGPNKLAAAERLALTAISAAEELGHKLNKAGETISSADKLRFAVEQFQKLAGKFGLSLSDEQAKALIEAVLNQYRDVVNPEVEVSK